MKNHQVIIVNGMQRGGTNLVWNLLQSHPRVVSPMRETGQVIYPDWTGRGRLGRAARRLARRAIRTGFRPCLNRIDDALYRQKMATLDDEDNRYKNHRDAYTAGELETVVLVTKSVGEDIFITPALARFFPRCHCVSVVRHGLAVCEGWIRRGASPVKAANAYKRSVEEMLSQDRVLANHLLVKFEDCLAHPNDRLDEMCRFAELDPAEIPGIRIKAKRTVGQNGEHTARFGSEGRKVWIRREETADYFDLSVTDSQIRNLSPEHQRIVTGIAGDTMQRLGYEL